MTRQSEVTGNPSKRWRGCPRLFYIMRFMPRPIGVAHFKCWHALTNKAHGCGVESEAAGHIRRHIAQLEISISRFRQTSCNVGKT